MSEEAEAVAEEATEETTQNDSLIDVAPEQPVEKEETPAHLVSDEEVTVEETAEPVKVEKPEYLEERFWDEEKGETDVEKLAQSYNEMRRKLSKYPNKVPKEYNLEHLQNVDREDEALVEFLDLAKEEQLTQGQFDTLTQYYLDLQSAQYDAIETDRATEMAKLGRNADSTIKSVEAWVGKFSKSGVLSETEVEAIGQASKSAAFVSALNKIRRAYNEPTIPSTKEVQTETEPTTIADIQSMMQDERYGADPAFTQRVERMVYAMHGEKLPS